MNNTIQLRASLRSSKELNDNTLNKLRGVKEVLSSVKSYAEKSNIQLSATSAPAALKKHITGVADAMTSKLASSLTGARRMGNDIQSKIQYAEMSNIIKNDIATIKSRLTNEINVYAESMMAGAYHPFQLALLPHVYLETINNNSRFLMPVKEYVSEQLPPRKILVRQIVIDGKKYDFPHCMKNPEVLRKLRTMGSKPFEFELKASDHGNAIPEAFNIFEKSKVGKKGSSSLVPQLDIIEIKYQDDGTSSEETVKTSACATMADANNYTLGRFLKSVKSSTSGATDTVTVSGEVNFATGDVKILASPKVKSIKFKCYLSGAFNGTSASIDMDTKPIVQLIKNRINMIFDYDPGSMQNYLALENIDGVLEGQSIIFDAVIATKDQFAFDTLNGVLDDLKSELAANITHDNLDRGFYMDTHIAQPGSTSGFHPTSPEQWDIEELSRRMKNLHTKISTKFRSTAGMQYNWWGTPVNVQRFVRSTPIISKSEEYGGMMNDYAVYALQIAGVTSKMVETERASDDDGLKCVPYSNMDSQPTFEFQQGPHAMYSDGTLRHPARPHMPAIAYYDYFDCNYVFAVLGQIKLEETGQWKYMNTTGTDK